MRSRASFFSAAMFRKNLCRLAPLWIGYFLLWLVLLPAPVLTGTAAAHGDPAALATRVLGAGLNGGCVTGLLYAALVAMATHAWMYRSRSVSAMAALPIRREAHCLTNLATALTVSLGPNIVIALLCWAASAGYDAGGAETFRLAMTWLSMVTLQFVFFYGLAALCAAVVGQLLALPVLYGLLNFAAVVLGYVVTSVLSTFVYGLQANTYRLSFLSPAYHVLAHLSPETLPGPTAADPARTQVVFRDWRYLLLMAAVGAACLLAAFLLQRSRRMETAGDLVAVRPLRPVLKYCFTLGCALVLGLLATWAFYGWRAPPLWVMALCMLGGGMIGYFSAEMLLKKTFRVFRREWIGFGVFAACLLAAVGVMELDLLGYERRVPDAAAVTAVRFSSYGLAEVRVDDPARVADLTTLHRAIVRDKEAQEALGARFDDGEGDIDSAGVTFSYELADGATLERHYTVYCTEDLWLDGESLPRQLAAVLRDPYLVTLANTPDFPVSERQLDYGGVSYYDPARDYVSFDLSTAALYALYTDCILPDLRDGRLGYYPPFRFEDLDSEQYDAWVTLEFVERTPTADPDETYYRSIFRTYYPTVGSRTAARLEELGVPLTLQSAQQRETDGPAVSTVRVS